MARDGVLLVNLGTPAAPTAQAVRAYLAEFLSDPRVVRLPRLLWLPLLYGVILNVRPRRSARKYAAIWMPEGSPLAVHSERQAKLLSARLSRPVASAMRYGEPSIAAGVARLRASGAGRTIVLPLYPQYAESTAESVRDAIGPDAAMIEHFHDHPAYIAALAAGVQAHWKAHGRAERLVLSFHGLPRRAVARGDPYEKQCYATARLLASALAVGESEFLVTFQSRFGPAEWLQPYTQATLIDLARRGVKTLDVACPGFVSDCLETLEEIAIGGREAFLAAGGGEMRVIPCLNEDPAWIDALGAIVTPHLVS